MEKLLGWVAILFIAASVCTQCAIRCMDDEPTKGEHGNYN